MRELIVAFLGVFALCVLAYIVERTNWPDPAKWFAWLVVFALGVLLFMKISGVTLQ